MGPGCQDVEQTKGLRRLESKIPEGFILLKTKALSSTCEIPEEKGLPAFQDV